MNKSLRHLILPPLLLLLAACADDAPRPQPVYASASLNERGALVLRISADAPVDDAMLTAPDGRSFTGRISAPGAGADAGSSWRPGVVLGGSGGSSSGMNAGIGLSLPLKNPFASDRPARNFLSQAEFALPPEALSRYRADPRAWRLDLVLAGRDASRPAPAIE